MTFMGTTLRNFEASIIASHEVKKRIERKEYGEEGIEEKLTALKTLYEKGLHEVRAEFNEKSVVELARIRGKQALPTITQAEHKELSDYEGKIEKVGRRLIELGRIQEVFFGGRRRSATKG